MTLSDEEENFMKISKIVLNIIPKHLRQLFKTKWNDKYPREEWQSNEASGNDLMTKIRNVNSRYAEKLKAGDEKEWDTTILVYIFLYSGLCLIESDREKIWRVGPLPLLLSEEIDILRETRNNVFGHLPNMSCSSIEYEMIEDKLKRIARKIFGADAEKEIDGISELPTGKQQVDELRCKLQEENIRNEEFHNGTQLRIPITKIH